MPIFIEGSTGASPYKDPFIGVVNHTIQVKLDISTLTTDEVDAQGRLKPGVLLSRSGTKIGAQGLSSPAAAVADDDNAGNGTVGSLVGKAGKPSEVVTLRARSSTSFEVRGSRSGAMADATVGTPYVSAIINFTITAGGNAFAAGDEFTVAITEAVSDYVLGINTAAVKVVPPNPTNDTLAAVTADKFVVVGVIGIADRDAIEFNMGRVLNATEVAAFESGKCKLVLSRI